jgi:hypothetical protein
MIQAFMDTLEKYMETLTNNTSLHEDSLQEISYCIFISLYDQLDIRIAYIKHKSP